MSYTVTDLGAFPMTGNSHGVAVNDEGQVVGSAPTYGGATHAFLWQDGVPSDLGTLGGTYSNALSINDEGQVFGIADSDGSDHVFRWQDGVMADLGALGTLGGTGSLVYGMDDQGAVVGSSYLAGNGTFHAILWQGGAMTDLGTLGGSSAANGINDQGQVVGVSYLSGNGGPEHAFVWQGGVMTDLNSLLSNGAGWTLITATAINQGGQIVGYGMNPNGQTHAFLLTPDASPAAPGHFRLDASLARAAGQPHALLVTVVAPGPEPQRQPPPAATLADTPTRLEVTSILTSVFTPRQVQDSAFAELTDPLTDTRGIDWAP